MDRQRLVRRGYAVARHPRRAARQAILRSPSIPEAPEPADILLDAPQLKVKALALELEHLELANPLRIGKVRLAVENLDAALFLQTHLTRLLDTLNRLSSTLNLGLSLSLAPLNQLSVATAAWHNCLELTRCWFELPFDLAERGKRANRVSARSRRAESSRKRALRRA